MVEWLQERLNEGQDAADENGMEDGMTMEEQELADIGIRIGRRGGEETARWINERSHAEERSTGQMEVALGHVRWLMERANIQELPVRDPELLGQLMAELGVPARDRRQAPYTQWTRGQNACRPGVCFP